MARRRADLDPEIVAFAEASIAAERARVAAAQWAKEQALQRDLKRARRFVAVVSVLLLLAIAGGAIAFWQRGIAKENYLLALDQATGNMQYLANEYDQGNIPTTILQAQADRAQTVLNGLASAGDTDDILVSRVRLLDVLSLMEVTKGDTHAMQTAQEENAFADRLKIKNPSNLDWLRLLVHRPRAVERYSLLAMRLRECGATRARGRARSRRRAVLPPERLVPASARVDRLRDDRRFTALHGRP